MNQLRHLVGLILFIILFVPVYSQVSEPPCACCSEEYKQFDFWIGDWIVYSNGRSIGYNLITKIESNCILRENWKSSVSSHRGTSYTFYDRVSKKWTHVWIDNEGKTLLLKGNLKNNQMILTSEEYRDEKGNRVIEKITWTNNPDGTVRQIWEKSEDGGLAFSVQFDGLYRRRT